jgi:ABC-type uncharacterized transport system ATPase subunit
MRQGLLFNLQVKNLNDNGLNAIRKIAGVKEVTLEGSKVLIEINPQQSELRDQIVEVAVQQKMGVLEFSAEKLSLEEVFLQLTTQEHKPHSEAQS